VIDEAVLTRRIGSTSVMHAQIQRLIDVSEQPNVTVQVLPDAAGEHAGLEGSFMILGFGGSDPDAVYLDAATGGLYIEKPQDIARYAWVFDHVRAAAAGWRVGSPRLHETQCRPAHRELARTGTSPAPVMAGRSARKALTGNWLVPSTASSVRIRPSSPANLPACPAPTQTSTRAEPGR
jgi:hypothetical protein